MLNVKGVPGIWRADGARGREIPLGPFEFSDTVQVVFDEMLSNTAYPNSSSTGFVFPSGVT